MQLVERQSKHRTISLPKEISWNTRAPNQGVQAPLGVGGSWTGVSCNHLKEMVSEVLPNHPWRACLPMWGPTSRVIIKIISGARRSSLKTNPNLSSPNLSAGSGAAGIFSLLPRSCLDLAALSNGSGLDPTLTSPEPGLLVAAIFLTIVFFLAVHQPKAVLERRTKVQSLSQKGPLTKRSVDLAGKRQLATAVATMSYKNRD